MRITRRQLNNLIREEVSSVVLKESAGMDAFSLIDFASAYAGLPSDLRSILDKVVNGVSGGFDAEDIEELQASLGGFSEDLDAYLAEALSTVS